MKSFDVVFIVHRIFNGDKRKLGGADRIMEFLSFEGKDILLIEHPLTGLKEADTQKWNYALVSRIKNGGITQIEKVPLINLPVPFKWVVEVAFNVYYIRQNISGKPVLMASDPLNSLAGFFLFNKFSKKYFHCIDYSDKRFDNLFLNLFYNLILRISFRSSDYIGVVSQRIEDRIKSFYKVPQKKILYIPNSPVFRRIDLKGKEPNSIICTGGAIIKKYDYEKILEIMKLMRRKLSNVVLYALGTTVEDRDYFEKVKSLAKKYKVLDNIVFTEFLDKKETENYLKKAMIGLSFYSRDTSYYTYYGDSLKIREYALFGIPTVSDGNSATDLEMEENNAGFIVEDEVAAAEKIQRLFEDKALYSKMQGSCVLWAKKMDKAKILKDLEGKLFEG